MTPQSEKTLSGLTVNKSFGAPADAQAGAQNSLAVYVHWPFCLSKCPYCDFNSHVRAEIDEDAFAEALCRELDHRAALVPGHSVTSIFFGGGTPSLMSPISVERVIDRIASRWSVVDGIEITLEANPTSVEAKHFAGYRAAGVNRVSLGVQSLDDEALRYLGREHSAIEALRAVETAAQHFARYSFDLIYARPKQSEAAWRRELTQALSYAGDHLSLYELTLEPGTPFYAAYLQGRLTPISPEDGAHLYDVTQEVCTDAGLPAYEISNHARPGGECRHNLSYWRYGEYVGVGPGAHGRVVVDGVRQAQECVRLPESWLANVTRDGHGFSKCTPISPEQAGEEYLLMGLRLNEGVSLARFESFTGQGLDGARVQQLGDDGYLVQKDDRLIVTPQGRLVLDRLLSELLV